MKVIKNTLNVIPGLALSLIIAVIARAIENALPIHVIGASVIALFLGMIIFLHSTKFILKCCVKCGKI